MGRITFIYLKILRMLKPRSEISEFTKLLKTTKQSGEEKKSQFLPLIFPDLTRYKNL